MPFHDYQQRFRRDRMQQLVQALDAANAVAILKQLSLFQPAATAASIFDQYSQLPLLLAELLARLAAPGVTSALMPASLVKAWQALAVLRSRSEVSAHLRGRSPRRQVYAMRRVDASAVPRVDADSSTARTCRDRRHGDASDGSPSLPRQQQQQHAVVAVGVDPCTLPRASANTGGQADADSGSNGCGGRGGDDRDQPSSQVDERRAAGSVDGGCADGGRHGGTGRRPSCVVALAAATADEVMVASLTPLQLVKILQALGALYAADPEDARRGLRRARPPTVRQALSCVAARLAGLGAGAGAIGRLGWGCCALHHRARAREALEPGDAAVAGRVDAARGLTRRANQDRRRVEARPQVLAAQEHLEPTDRRAVGDLGVVRTHDPVNDRAQWPC